MSATSGQRLNHWLHAFAGNYASQYGEDGIINKILEILPESNGWCVEFGAGDGRIMSNTHFLITQKNYAAVLIEPAPARFQGLVRTYQNASSVACMNQYVGYGPEDNLDKLLAATAVPANLDVLSIDIDGNDYHVWEAVSHYQPKILIIEFNPTIPNEVEFVQARDMRAMHGSSIRSLCQLGKRKGYELVATTFANAIFVDARYFTLFGIQDNSIPQLRLNQSAVSYIFQGYDGTVFLRGSPTLHWHGFPLHKACLQLLPAVLRKYPENYDAAEQQLFQLYKELFDLLFRKDPEAAKNLTTVGAPPRPDDPEELRLRQAIAKALQYVQGRSTWK